MICPYCRTNNDKVIDSRLTEGGKAIRRRRQCLNPDCKKRFTTYERVEETSKLVVIKKDGSRDPFDPRKILVGLQAACGKRPIPEEMKHKLIEEVEEQVNRTYDREVHSLDIGRMVMAKLRELDEIAYIRFASEYFAFRGLEDLAAEVGELQHQSRDIPAQGQLFDSEGDEKHS